MGKYDSIPPEVRAYAEEKICESGIRMVPGHYPVFESKEHVDMWLKMSMYGFECCPNEEKNRRQMIIQIDSREKTRAIKSIVAEFDRQGVKHPISKLMVGDYMNYDNPRVIVDRKQNLTELCQNICQDHERFRRELIRAQEAEIKLIILVEHGKGINTLVDVIWWENPRLKQSPKATRGEVLYKKLVTIERKYGCKFEFCERKDTGMRIIELLGGTNG